MWLRTEQNARLTGRCDVSFGESRKCSATPCGVSVPHMLYIMTINLTTRIKKILITKHNSIQAILFVCHFVNHFTTNVTSLSLSNPSKLAPVAVCIACNTIVSSKPSTLQFSGRATSNRRTCALQTKLCRTFSIVSAATRRRRWPGSCESEIHSQLQRPIVPRC